MALTNEQNNLGDLECLQSCSHEEDSHILLHVKHCAKQGNHKLMIRTVDTDDFVLAVRHFHSLEIEELWISFGTFAHFSYSTVQLKPNHELVISFLLISF